MSFLLGFRVKVYWFRDFLRLGFQGGHVGIEIFPGVFGPFEQLRGFCEADVY